MIENSEMHSRYKMLTILRQNKQYILTKNVLESLVDSGMPNFVFKILVTEKGEGLEEIYLGETKDGSNTNALLVYLEKFNIAIEDVNRAEIAEMFEAVHPWTDILKSADDLDSPNRRIREGNEDKVTMYKKYFQPPVLEVKEGSRITFWAVHSLSGDLEQWEIFEDDQGKKRVESKVLENRLFY